MTDKEKLEKLKKLADVMYYAAQQLTTDASRLHKAMDEYHKFIIHEYKEEHISEDLDIAIGEYCSNPDNFITYIDVAFAYRSEQKDDIPLIIKAIKFGANWQKEQDKETIELAEDHAMLAGMEKMKGQMMKEAVDGTVFTQLEDGEIMVRSHYFKSEKFNYLDEVKLLIIKKE